MILDKVEKQKYRHELKYVCTEAQLALLQARIHHLIPLDKHVGESGMYQIRSLYFDDYYDRCYYENENGTDPREKFRIRIYNGKTDKISLELKKKERGKTLKLSCPLTEEQCRTLMKGEPLPDSPDYHPVLQKLLLLMKTTMMKTWKMDPMMKSLKMKKMYAQVIHVLLQFIPTLIFTHIITMQYIIV